MSLKSELLIDIISFSELIVAFRPEKTDNFAWGFLESSVPKELIVMLTVQRSASKSEDPVHHVQCIGEPRVVQKL